MLAAIVPNSARPFNFHTELAMTEEMVSCLLITNMLRTCICGFFHCPVLWEYSSLSICAFPQALKVSDHYPVEVELRSAPPFWMKKSNHRRDTVSRAVTGKEQNCNLLLPVADGHGVKYLRRE